MKAAPHLRGAPGVAALQGDLRRRTHILAEAARRTHARTDSEAIHDLRVSARRLNAALSLWRSALPARTRRRASGGVRRLRQALGPAREHEVLLYQLEERLRGAPAAMRLAAFPILERLRRKVTKSARKANRISAPPRIEKVLKHLDRASARLTGVPLDDATMRLHRHVETAGVAVRTALADSGDEPLHRARIAVKKWRYALESMRSIQPDIEHKPGYLRGLQRTLGSIHDAAVLRDFLQREIARMQRSDMHEHAECLLPLTADIEAERLHAVQAFREAAATLRLDSA